MLQYKMHCHISHTAAPLLNDLHRSDELDLNGQIPVMETHMRDKACRYFSIWTVTAFSDEST
jgi:hypothetical protein